MRWYFKNEKSFDNLFLVFLLMQFIRPQKVEYSEDETYEIVLPPDIKEIFVRACYDCHSNKINYPWYSNVAPFLGLLQIIQMRGVNALNFSNWEKYTQTQKMKN